jgi:hypothetical protein
MRCFLVFHKGTVTTELLAQIACFPDTFSTYLNKYTSEEYYWRLIHNYKSIGITLIEKEFQKLTGNFRVESNCMKVTMKEHQ